MRKFLVLAVAGMVLVSSLAEAQGWRLYTYRDQGFAAQFPAEPTLITRNYQTANGTAVTERQYSANSGGVLYTVAVADFRRTNPNENAVIDEAANALIRLGKLTHDVSARVNWNYGREIRVVDAQGTSYTDAIFVANGKLFQLKVTYPAANTDPNGSSGIHFFQQAFELLL